MKRHLFPLAAVLAFALGVTGGALAKGHPAKSHHAKRQAPAVAGGHVHSLIPGIAPHPRVWLRALRELRHNQKLPHKARLARPGQELGNLWCASCSMCTEVQRFVASTPCPLFVLCGAGNYLATRPV